jgi:hypothetical protein
VGSVARGWGGKNGELFNENRVSTWKEENIPEADDGDGCAPVGTSLMLLKVKFLVGTFYHTNGFLSFLFKTLSMQVEMPLLPAYDLRV